jgi:hypothetical protein
MTTINWTEEKKQKAIEMLTKYFEKHGIGEMIMQNDEALIQAPELLSDIADEVLIENEGIVFNYENE